MAEMKNLLQNIYIIAILLWTECSERCWYLCKDIHLSVMDGRGISSCSLFKCSKLLDYWKSPNNSYDSTQWKRSNSKVKTQSTTDESDGTCDLF